MLSLKLNPRVLYWMDPEIEDNNDKYNDNDDVNDNDEDEDESNGGAVGDGDFVITSAAIMLLQICAMKNN